jgi:nucleotide-binding universal stress UspA family protein
MPGEVMSDSSADRFRNICFAATGSAGDAMALERTLRLCELASAELTIVRPIEPPPSGVLRIIESLGIATESCQDLADEKAALDALLQQAQDRNIRARGEIVEGPAALETIRRVQRDDADLLVKVAQPTTTLRHMLFGHTDRQLVRDCPCPVWIENPAVATNINRVLAAVDPAPFSDELTDDPDRAQLNASILQLGVQIAKLEEAELHVVHAWHFHLEWQLQSRAGVGADAVARVGESVRQKHEQALVELLAPYRPDIARVHLVKGKPADVLPKIVGSEDIDVLVMGTTCRSGIAGWLIGNTAETALDQVDCSLVTLKPPGFKSIVPATPVTVR